MVNAAVKTRSIKTSSNTVTAVVAASPSPPSATGYHYPLNIITGIMTTFKIPYRAEIQTLITNPVSSKVSSE